jgi:dihydroflavonol-4-reductase
MIMKVFVTGGNGFIGSNVVEELIKSGYEVRCLLRTTSKTKRIDAFKYETAIGDILDKESLIQGMKGCDAVIHLASISSWYDIHNSNVTDIVIKGTQNVLEAAVSNANLPVVYFSSSTAVGCSKKPIKLSEETPFNLTSNAYSYAIAKHNAENICREFHNKGLRVVMVNPAEVYGPNDYDKITCGTLIDFIKESPVFIPKGGTSIVHVQDVARGAIAALEKGRSGERYILGGDCLTVHQLAELTLEIANLNKKIITVPNFLILGIANVGKLLKINLPFNPEVIPYAVRYWFMDNSKAKNELGVSFRSSRQVLTSVITWLQNSNMV